MAKKRGFFARLFGLGRRKDEFELSAGSVLARLLGAAMERTSGAGRKIAAERIDAETLLAGIGPAGWRAAYFADSDPPDLILFFPADTLSVLSGNVAVDAGGFPPLLKEATANLADFLRTRKDAKAEGGGIPRPHLRFFRRYDARDSEEIAWRAAGSACFRLSAVYACIEHSVHGLAEDSFASDDAYADAVRAMASPRAAARAGTPPTAEPGIPRRVELQSPREFIAGTVFLKPRFPCGKYIVETRFSEAEVLSDRNAYAGAPGGWVLTQCTVSGKKWPVWFHFPLSEDRGGTRTEEIIRGIAGCALRESQGELAVLFGSSPTDAGIALGQRPDLAGKTGYVILKAAVSAGAGRFACELFVDFALVTQIARAALDPAEIASTAKGASSILPLLFAANSELFAGRIGSFHRAFLPAEGSFPFAAFLDLIPARDRAIALQNFVLRSLGTRRLRSLFSYSETVPQPDGSARTRVLTPYAVDEPGLLSLLPEAAREEWQAARASPPVPEADHRRLVSETLEGIRREMTKKRLLMSPRALLVLDKFVMPGLRASASKSLEAAAAAGVPFSTVRLLPKPQIQQFFGTRSNRSLALCVIGAEKELGFINGNVSAARAAQLAEDIVYIRREYGAGRLEAGDVLAAMRETEAAARAMIEEREKQAERERARKAGIAARRRAK